MRPRLRLTHIWLVVLLAACRAAPSPSSELGTCPKLLPTVVPPGFVVAERWIVDAGGGRTGETVVYRDEAGRELTFGSGSPGEIGGAGTGQRVVVRQREAEVMAQPAIETLAITWLEAAPDEPCHQYRIIGVGLDLAEFLEVLAGVE